MTSPYERVYLRLRGRSRGFPLMSLAAAFHRDLDATADALEILVGGPADGIAPDATPFVPASPSDNRRAEPSPLRGEGEGGGERSETLKKDLEERSERERSEISDEAELALRFARELDDTKNFAAIRKLVRAYPEPLLDEALRRTLAVPGDRVRGTRGALFTGIVRRLARDGWTPADS